MAHEFFKRKTPERKQNDTSPQELGASAVRYATEHSRSLEDREKYQALETLRELGVLIPLADIDTYHGRAGSKDSREQWAVDPHFKNLLLMTVASVSREVMSCTSTPSYAFLRYCLFSSSDN